MQISIETNIIHYLLNFPDYFIRAILNIVGDRVFSYFSLTVTLNSSEQLFPNLNLHRNSPQYILLTIYFDQF